MPAEVVALPDTDISIGHSRLLLNKNNFILNVFFGESKTNLKSCMSNQYLRFNGFSCFPQSPAIYEDVCSAATRCKEMWTIGNIFAERTRSSVPV